MRIFTQGCKNCPFDLITTQNTSVTTGTAGYCLCLKNLPRDSWPSDILVCSSEQFRFVYYGALKRVLHKGSVRYNIKTKCTQVGYRMVLQGWKNIKINVKINIHIKVSWLLCNFSVCVSPDTGQST